MTSGLVSWVSFVYPIFLLMFTTLTDPATATVHVQEMMADQLRQRMATKATRTRMKARRMTVGTVKRS